MTDFTLLIFLLNGIQTHWIYFFEFYSEISTFFRKETLLPIVKFIGITDSKEKQGSCSISGTVLSCKYIECDIAQSAFFTRFLSSSTVALIERALRRENLIIKNSSACSDIILFGQDKTKLYGYIQIFDLYLRGSNEMRTTTVADSIFVILRTKHQAENVSKNENFKPAEAALELKSFIDYYSSCTKHIMKLCYRAT